MTLIIARRGAADVAPANSLAAIEQGIERGADGVEVEVRLSRDAELVVIREARMPFVGPVLVPVDDLTLAELKTIDIGAEQQGFRGTRISTMAEIVDLLAGSEARLVIDVKEDPLHSEGATPTAIAVAELVRACQLHERATITSTNHSSMAALAIAHPQLQIGLRHLVAMEAAAGYAVKHGARSLHPIGVGAATADVSAAGEQNVAIIASTLVAEFWPISEEEQLNQLFALGVDAVVTDSSGLALAQRKAHA